jgi:hypothetical protein
MKKLLKKTNVHEMMYLIMINIFQDFVDFDDDFVSCFQKFFDFFLFFVILLSFHLS